MSIKKPQAKQHKWLPIGLVVLTCAVLVWVVWRIDTQPRTDDAYVYADTIDVVPQVSGKIIHLAVRDNQAVKQGDVLFQLDPRPYEDDLVKARASLAQLDRQIPLTQRTVDAQAFNAAAARASVTRARAAAAQAADTLRRMAPLIAKGYISADELERARTAANTSQAELDAAESQARQAQAGISSVDALVAQRAVILAEISAAQLNLEYTTVKAPFDGRVASLRTATGQFASSQKSVFTLIDTRQWYVVANFRETELRHIQAGSTATVYLMSDPGEHFQGTVDSIGYGVNPEDGGQSVGGLPSVQRTINWVHVAQRFPVKIRVDHADPNLFRIGTSAVAILQPCGSDDRCHP